VILHVKLNDSCHVLYCKYHVLTCPNIALKELARELEDPTRSTVVIIKTFHRSYFKLSLCLPKYHIVRTYPVLN